MHFKKFRTEWTYDAQDLSLRFGADKWVPMRRFMHQQPCSKLRPIDDGKWSGHNAVSWAEETIFTASPDFVTSARKEWFALITSRGLPRQSVSGTLMWSA